MNITILQQAFDELYDAVEYYEEQQAELGTKFKDEVDQHVKWITRNPYIPMIREGGYSPIK
jgi:hypothetical protein